MNILLEDFFQNSGIRANIDKTKAFMIGKHIKFKNNYNLKWYTGTINILSVHICENETENYNLNFAPKIKQIIHV